MLEVVAIATGVVGLVVSAIATLLAERQRAMTDSIELRLRLRNGRTLRVAGTDLDTVTTIAHEALAKESASAVQRRV